MSAARRIFFWSPFHRPDQFVRDVAPDRRAQLGSVLALGRVRESYLGDASCRICGITLGSADLEGFGFIWPAKAEHYVLEHNVWPAEADELMRAYDAFKAVMESEAEYDQSRDWDDACHGCGYDPKYCECDPPPRRAG